MVPTRVFVEVKVVKLVIHSDHHVIKDNETGWSNSGSLYAKPEFTYGKRSAPASHTKGQYLSTSIDFEVWPPEAPQLDCVIEGTTKWGVTLKGSAKLKGGTQTVSMAAQLPDSVKKLAGDIRFTVDNGVDGVQAADASWGHSIYLTFDTPVDRVGTDEAGITDKRMSTAVRLVSNTGWDDPHGIVDGLMGLVPGYTLTKNPSVPAHWGHPEYFNSGGGAWALAEYLDKRAECQAICRFVMAVLKHVGCPGEGKVVVVWSDPDIDDGRTAQVADWPAGGLNGKTKIVNGVEWNAYLLDRHAVAGQVFQTKDPDVPNYMGCNNFEACLLFEHGGEKKYYGGGAGVYASPEQVVTAFHSLCWVSNFQDPDSRRPMVKIEDVVRRWRGADSGIIPTIPVNLHLRITR